MNNVYTLKDFIADLNRITDAETSQEKIVAAAKPLLTKLVQQPNCIEAKYQKPRRHGLRSLHASSRSALQHLVSGLGTGR